MNIIKLESQLSRSRKYKLSDLLLQRQQNETAFVGKCGSGPSHALYLITYNYIVLANDPIHTWDTDICPVIVDYFVDVEISIIRKEYP